MRYEHLVLAFGNRARIDLLPGMAEHAFPLKTVGDSMHIRNMVLRRLAQIELTGDPTERRRLGRFVIVGGGFSGVETAGELVDCLDGKHAPPTSQFAVREAQRLAANLLAVLQGQPTRVFDYRSRGSKAAIGRHNGVAEIFGLPISGFPAWLLWRAYYLAQMPTFGRKLRIFVEWTWGMFFPADITHLRFNRSHESGPASAAPDAAADARQPRRLTLRVVGGAEPNVAAKANPPPPAAAARSAPALRT